MQSFSCEKWKKKGLLGISQSVWSSLSHRAMSEHKELSLACYFCLQSFVNFDKARTEFFNWICHLNSRMTEKWICFSTSQHYAEPFCVYCLKQDTEEELSDPWGKRGKADSKGFQGAEWPWVALKRLLWGTKAFQGDHHNIAKATRVLWMIFTCQKLGGRSLGCQDQDDPWQLLCSSAIYFILHSFKRRTWGMQPAFSPWFNRLCAWLLSDSWSLVSQTCYLQPGYMKVDRLDESKRPGIPQSCSSRGREDDYLVLAVLVVTWAE